MTTAWKNYDIINIQSFKRVEHIFIIYGLVQCC